MKPLEETGATRDDDADERNRRLREVWRMMDPSPTELRAARAKFRSARSGPARRRILPVIVALAVVLVAVAASAAARVAWRRIALPSRETPLPVASVAARMPKAPSSEPSGPLLAPAPTASIASIASTALPLASAERDRPNRHAPLTAVAPAAPTPVAPLAPESSAWLEAAAALRAGDYARAEAAFSDLARSRDGHTRDAARLARAKVWIAQGRGDDARGELDDLARSGHSVELRQEAAATLDQLR
jgi:Tetratricopeptide repeat